MKMSYIHSDYIFIRPVAYENVREFFFLKAENRPRSTNLQNVFFEQTNTFFGGELLTKTNYGNYEIIGRSR